jgi:hypothetical protein
LKGAITELVNNGKRYLSIKALKTYYSPKMATIYERITGATKHGACHLVYDGRKDDVLSDTQEEITTEFTDVGTNEDGKQGEDEIDATEMKIIEDIKPGAIKDPDDPLLKHMEVFMTDDELKQKGARVSGGPALVYSFFNTVEGAGIFSKILDLHGFTEFSDTTEKLDAKTIARMPRYAFIRGGMDLKLKINIMRIFNSKANVHGQLIRVVFVTQAAAEGISLFNLRQIHIMEPFWDNVMIEQVEGRGFRIKAHQYIQNSADRFITVYKYVSHRASYTSKLANINASTESTDQYILDLAKKKDVFREEVKLLRARAAVDCINNGAYNDLGAKCFTFNDTKGRSYTAEIDGSSREPTERIVGQKINATREFNVVDRVTTEKYLTFVDDPAVKISITRAGGSLEVMADIVYVAPPGWKQGDSSNKSLMRIAGYLAKFNVTGGKTIVKFMEDITNIKRVNEQTASLARPKPIPSLKSKQTSAPAPAATAAATGKSETLSVPKQPSASAQASKSAVGIAPKSMAKELMQDDAKEKLPMQIKGKLRKPPAITSTVTEIEGDLLKLELRPDHDLIVHQANCKSTRAAGLALNIFKTYPDTNIYKDKKVTREVGKALITEPVVHLFGENDPSNPPSELPERPGWFQQALDDLALKLESKKDITLYFPYGIGCGLAKGNWKTYRDIIETWSKENTNIKVFIVRKPK